MSKLNSAKIALKTMRDSAARYHVGYAALAKRFFHLNRARRFSPREIYFNDLLNPRISDETLKNYISWGEWLKFNRKRVLNGYGCVTMDKSVFYAVCSAACAPIPRLLAVFDTPAGWAPDGRILQTQSDWCGFAESLPTDFIVKPALGLQGRGVTAFRREGGDFVDHEGRRHRAEGLYEFLRHSREHNLFAGEYSFYSLRLAAPSNKMIIQERLYAHRLIAELTGSRAVSTCRLLTFAADSGEPEVWHSAFRATTGDNIVDNSDKGTRGNLWCSVDSDTGRITDAFVMSKGSDRQELVDRHPTSGREIVGFRVPHWNDAVRLSMRLAAIFRPQQLLTWDVAVTDRGPVIVEGNVCSTLLPSPLNRSACSLLEQE